MAWFLLEQYVKVRGLLSWKGKKGRAGLAEPGVA
jgi:hypothetical protein